MDLNLNEPKLNYPSSPRNPQLGTLPTNQTSFQNPKNNTSFTQNQTQNFEEFNQFNQHFNSELQQRNNEVSSQYRLRKNVYENVLNELKDHEKAICYSNIWANKTYLGVKYPKQVEELVMKYAPKI